MWIDGGIQGVKCEGSHEDLRSLGAMKSREREMFGFLWSRKQRRGYAPQFPSRIPFPQKPHHPLPIFLRTRHSHFTKHSQRVTQHNVRSTLSTVSRRRQTQRRDTRKQRHFSWRAFKPVHRSPNSGLENNTGTIISLRFRLANDQVQVKARKLQRMKATMKWMPPLTS